jgi:hypothetical protein
MTSVPVADSAVAVLHHVVCGARVPPKAVGLFNGGNPAAVVVSQVTLPHARPTVSATPPITSVLGRKLVASDAVGLVLIPRVHSALCRTVGHVRFLVPEKEVVRVDALPDVAFVANIEAFGNRPIMQLPRKPVGPQPSDSPIPVDVTGPHVDPTTVGLANVSPKSVLKGRWHPARNITRSGDIR